MHTRRCERRRYTKGMGKNCQQGHCQSHSFSLSTFPQLKSSCFAISPSAQHSSAYSQQANSPYPTTRRLNQPSLSPFSENSSENAQSPKSFALTFDDGHSIHTEELLDMLKENDVPAMFFLNDNNV